MEDRITDKTKIVEKFFQNLVEKATNGDICNPWKNKKERDEYFKDLIQIVSDEKSFTYLGRLMEKLNISGNPEDKSRYKKINVLLKGITTNEVCSIAFIDIPMALHSYFGRSYTHSFLLWNCRLIDDELNDVFEYTFQGFEVALLLYTYTVSLGKYDKAKNILRGWVKEKAEYIRETTGIEIDIDKYTKALEEGLQEWAKKMHSKAYEMYVKSLKELLEAPFFDDINNLNINQITHMERNLLGEFNLRKILPNRPISILRHPFTFISDIKVNKAIAYNLTDNLLPTFLLIQYNNEHGLETFKKVYIEDDHSLGRLGINLFVIADPHYHRNESFKLIKSLSKELLDRKLDALLVDLVLGNALGDTIAKGLLKEMKSSVHKDFSDNVIEHINTLDRGLAIAVGKQFEPLFRKMDKYFNPYKLNSLEEIINRFKDKGKWAVQKFRDLMATLVEDNDDLIKDIEERLDNNQDDIPTRTSEILRDIIENTDIYDKTIKEALKKLKEFSIRTGSFLHEVFSNIANSAYNIDKGTTERRKKAILKAFEKIGFKNENIINKIKNKPLLEKQSSVVSEMGEEKDRMYLKIVDNSRGLTEVYERYKSGITENLPSDRAREVINELNGKYMITNNTTAMKELLEGIIEKLENVSGNERQLLYSKIAEINEKAFCMKGEGKLKIGDKEVSPLRFNERYRGIEMIADVLTAFKMFTKKEDDFKKLATMFTLALFGVSPVSLHILKQLGITKEAK